MLLKFGSHLTELRWRGVRQYDGVKIETIIRDIGGDLDTAETYLRLGRQKRKLGAIIDSFLETLVIREHVIDEGTDLDALLEGHQGEVWLTGHCLVHEFNPALHDTPGVTSIMPGVDTPRL